MSIEDEDRYKKEGEECGNTGPLVSGWGKTKSCGQCIEGLTCQLTFNLISKCGKCSKPLGININQIFLFVSGTKYYTKSILENSPVWLLVYH